MDHVPLPPSNSQGHTPVNYTEVTDRKLQWDYGEWKTFEARCGISCRELFEERKTSFSPDRQERRTRDATVLAQSWLFFGVIAEFFSIRIDVDEWTSVTAAGQRTLSTKSLAGYVRKWMSSVQRLENDAASSLILEKSGFIEMASQPFDYLAKANASVPPELMIAISFLHATLSGVLNAVSGLEENIVRGLDEFYTYNRVFDVWFRQRGWCLSDQSLLRQNVSFLTEYYAAHMSPIYAAREHGGCNADRCTAYTLDVAKYRTRHLSVECHCDFVGLDSSVIAELVTRDETPLIIWKEWENGQSEVKIIPRARNEHYVCYSHVWSDGLGNVSCNAIPRCQIQYLQRKASELSRLTGNANCSQTPFWLDTLCVPVGLDHKQARNKAIANMARIYEEATQVLVLSHEITDVSAQTLDAELILRVSHTPWFRRLWTLQEGVLAQTVWFQLRERAINMTELVRASMSVPDSTCISGMLYSYILEESKSQIRKLIAFREVPAEEKAGHIWSAVQWRTTSWASDETVCLSSLLRISLDHILMIDKESENVLEQRMRAFILTQRHFPARTLFKSNLNRQSRQDQAALDLPGFRWAPRSFVFRQVQAESGSRWEDYMGTADEQGFHVQFPGMQLKWEDLVDWSPAEVEESFSNFVVGENRDCFYHTLFYDDCWQAVPRDLRKDSTPFIVLEHDVFSLTEDDDQDARGVFVTVKNDTVSTTDTMLARLWGTVFVDRYDIDTDATTIWHRQSFLSETRGMKQCQPLTPHRKWCIG